MIPQFTARYAPWILMALGVFIIVLRTLEYLASTNEDPAYYLSNVLLTVLLLIVAGLLTHMLTRSLTERTQAMNLLRLRHDLAIRFASYRDVPSLVGEMVTQVNNIVPAADVGFYLYEGKQNRLALLNTAAPEIRSDPGGAGRRAGLDPAGCGGCFAVASPVLRSLGTCQQATPYGGGDYGYCIPLIQGAAPVGLLQLRVSGSPGLSAHQESLIENVSVVLSSSLFIAMDQQAHERDMVTHNTRTLQLSIARDLHDTIGQNISYLRMRLLQLSGMALRDKKRLTAEIRHLSAVADESYDLIRSTLGVLHSGFAGDLPMILKQHGELVGERTNLRVDLSSEGWPRSLTPGVVQQLFFIFRESLSNIEKHANARRVSVQLNWGERDLTLRIQDDGCGFDVESTPEDHYGLRFMRERAELLKGSFSVLSTIGAGTQIVVCVPIEPTEKDQLS